MRIAGIDPGNKGAIAIVEFKGPKIVGAEVLRFEGMDLTNPNHVKEIYRFIGSNNIDAVFLERINPFRQGRKAWKILGMWFGTLFTSCIASCFTPTLVLAKTWQTALNCRTGGDKKITRFKAQKLFSKYMKVTDHEADALLIAVYGRTQMKTRLNHARPNRVTKSTPW